MAAAQLICKVPPGIVNFDFNPDQISMKRNVDLKSRPTSSPGGANVGSTGSIFRGAAQSDITINNIVLHGGNVKGRCDQLLDWMNPGGGLIARLGGALLSAATGLNLATNTPTLTFMWGPPDAAFMYDVKLSAATILYKRFNTSGEPTRADVSLTMKEQPSLIGSLPTNPTSGGLPGRQVHIVSDNENLQSISTQAYGSPGFWRAIAQVNAIDDPMRVPAGRELYLPNATELEGIG